MSSSSDHGSICLACGRPLPVCLLIVASLRCHRCRDVDAPLTARLAER